MKSDIDRLYLIDRYLKGELSGLTLDEFKSRMRSSPEFAEEVESQRAIIEGIKLARREHLLSVLKGERQPVKESPVLKVSKATADAEPSESQTPRIPNEPAEVRFNYNNWYYAAAAVLFAGFFLYFIFGYYLPRQNAEVAQVDTLQTDKDSGPTPEASQPESAQTDIPTADTAAGSQTQMALQDATPADSLAVQKDRKLAERQWQVPTLETVEAPDNPTNPNVNQGQNGELKLDNVRKVKGNTLKVEYWQSVVHFKGYKLSDNRLLLFDVAPDEQVTCKMLDNQLYFKRAGQYYLLRNSGKFEQYEKVGDAEVIKILDTH